jgi:hypothetical protein
MFLIGVNIALFLIGMFIETSAAIIVLAPILTPVAIHFGVDPIHFGIIMVVNLALGMITPPFGVNLFAACSVAQVSLDKVIRYLVPFVLTIMACLMLISYVPQISLTLRDLVYSQTPATAPAPAPLPLAPSSVGPSPVGPSSVGPTPVGPTPVGPSPVGPSPVGPTPVGPTPVGPTPVGPTPVGPSPVGPTPVGPSSAN